MRYADFGHMPSLIDARNYCPDVFAVICSCSTPGPGTTPMGYQSRTVYRMPGESDGAIWTRVLEVVNQYKDCFGIHQSVRVLCLYDLTVEDGARRCARQDALNFESALRFMAGYERNRAMRKAYRSVLADFERLKKESRACAALALAR